MVQVGLWSVMVPNTWNAPKCHHAFHELVTQARRRIPSAGGKVTPKSPEMIDTFFQALSCIYKACLGAAWSITLWDNWEFLITHESQPDIDASILLFMLVCVY